MDSNIPIEARSLGEPVAVFKTNYMRFLVQILVFIGFGWFFVDQFLQLKNSGAKSDSDIFMLLFPLAFWGFALRAVIILLLNINLRVFVFPSGITYTRLGDTHMLLWRDIETVWKKQYKYTLNLIPAININKLDILDRDGHIHKLSRILRRFSDLSAMIMEKVFEDKFPTALDKLENGGTLDFPPFQLNKTGITFKEKSARWEELGELQFWQGTIYFKKSGTKPIHRAFISHNWVSLSVFKSWKVPNFDLMLALATYYIERNQNADIEA